MIPASELARVPNGEHVVRDANGLVVGARTKNHRSAPLLANSLLVVALGRFFLLPPPPPVSDSVFSVRLALLRRALR